MGSSHSVHILMNINLTAVGRTLMASSRLSQASVECNAENALGPRALLDLQIDVEDDELSDADDCHVPEPPVPSVEDLYALDWKEPEGHTAMKLEDFVEAARAANADATRRTFVVMHLFSGRRRKHDLEH